jgi:hypothetical protein
LKFKKSIKIAKKEFLVGSSKRNHKSERYVQISNTKYQKKKKKKKKKLKISQNSKIKMVRHLFSERRKNGQPTRQ